MYQYGKTMLFFSVILLLGGCGSNQSLSYVNGFPDSESPALTGFIEHLITSYPDSRLFNDNGTFIYSKGNIIDNQTSIDYFQFTEDQLTSFYEPLFHTNDHSLELNELRNSDELLQLGQPVKNREDYNLPIIELIENNQLEITTPYNHATIDINEVMKDYNITNESSFIVNLMAVTEDNMLITLEDTSLSGGISTLYYLFIDQQLSDYTIVQFHQEDPHKVIQSENLKSYYDLFPEVNNYISVLGSIIVNTETDEITLIDDEDLLSKDGKYIYIGGDISDPSENLPDGVQRILTIENYAKGNDVLEEEFSIDYGEISKQLDFDTKNIITSDIVYFNEDYVILTLLYAGRLIGHGGETNVLIDLQDKENPTAYLVNLGIM